MTLYFVYNMRLGTFAQVVNVLALMENIQAREKEVWR